ncbi:MAG: hypothetical protein ACE5OZ_20620 [Candidatus Heimdallarchaeota archaeon]
MNPEIGIALFILLSHTINPIIPALLPLRFRQLPLLIRPQLPLSPKDDGWKSLVLAMLFPKGPLARRFLRAPFQPFQFLCFFLGKRVGLLSQLLLIGGEPLVGFLRAPLGFSMIQRDEFVLTPNERLCLGNGGAAVPGIG